MRRAYAILLLFLAIPLAACGVAESPTAALPTAQPTSQATAGTIAPPNEPTAIALPTEQTTEQPTEMPSSEPTAIGPIVGENSVPPDTGPPLTSIVQQTPTPLTSPKVVTLQDQQQTIHLKVGEGFVLQLEEGYTWQIRIADERILRQDHQASLPAGAQGMFTAPAEGKTVLEAQGTPLCAKENPPCMRPDILFEITVLVQR